MSIPDSPSSLELASEVETLWEYAGKLGEVVDKTEDDCKLADMVNDGVSLGSKDGVGGLAAPNGLGKSAMIVSTSGTGTLL